MAFRQADFGFRRLRNGNGLPLGMAVFIKGGISEGFLGRESPTTSWSFDCYA